MELLQRYVDNVKTYLPGKLREDIGSELYSGLQDEYDEMSDTLGRAPTEVELSALLQRRGHPMEVAAAFRPRKTLVSEALFPLYTQVLKWVFLAVIVGNGAVAVLSLFQQSEPSFIRAAVQWLSGTLDSALYCFAWVTIGFYLAGESLSYRNTFRKWDPRKLPRIADANQRISQFESAVEFAAMLLFVGWLNDISAVFQSTDTAAINFAFSEEMRALLPWLNIAIGLRILLALDKLFVPYWTRAKLMVDGAINVFWLLLLAQLFSLQQVFSIEWGVNGSESWEMPLKNWQIIVVVTAIFTAFDLLKDLQRYRRVPNSDE